jgi:sarcosine oxidase subunit gamma
VADRSSHDPLAGIAFDRLPPAGAYGVPGEPGVVASTAEPFVALVVARPGKAASVVDRLHRAFSVPLADRPHAAIEGNTTVIGTAPSRFLVLSRTDADLFGTLRAILGTDATVTEQSDGYVTFNVTGDRTPDVFAKGALIDLDPVAFHVGDAVTTVIAHIGVTLWRSGEKSWRVLVGRSYEASFARFLIASAAEYGLRLESQGSGGRG